MHLWKTWAALTLLNGVAGASGAPLVAGVTSAQARGRVAVALGVQGVVLGGLAAAVGLPSARKLEVRFASAAWLDDLVLPAAAGAGVALAAKRLDRTLFPGQEQQLTRRLRTPPSRGAHLLAAAYGGIFEETVFRLGAQCAIAAGLMRATRSEPPVGRATAGASTVAASVLFGAAHLPAVRSIAPLSRAAVARTIGLNAVGGVVFGTLLWQRSLRAAVTAHAAADVVLRLPFGLRQAIT